MVTGSRSGTKSESSRNPAGSSAESAAGSAAGSSARRPRARRGASPGDATLSQALLEAIRERLNDDQAEDVSIIELAGKTAIADYMVIASGRNPRHMGAMAEHLRELIKAERGITPPIEGERQGDWILIDGGDVIVHLFRPEIRGLYNLEKMWGAGAPTGDDPVEPGQQPREPAAERAPSGDDPA